MLLKSLETIWNKAVLQ